MSFLFYAVTLGFLAGVTAETQIESHCQNAASGSALLQGSRSYTKRSTLFCTRPPCTVTDEERFGEKSCSFLRESGHPAACGIESPEHLLVRKHLQSNSVVLELGARYGTTSCEIAAKQNNSGRLVSVDPDSSVWDAFEENIIHHGCNVTLFKGFVGKGTTTVRGKGYAKQYRLVQEGVGSTRSAELVARTFSEMETHYNLKFDTLLIDCEGCFPDFLDQNPGVLNGIRTVLLEGDMGAFPKLGDHPWGVDYDKVADKLHQAGFDIVEQFLEKDGVGIARRKEGECCPDIRHVAWKRHGSEQAL